MTSRLSPLVLFLGGILAIPAFGQPAVSYSVPAAVRPGQTVEVTFHGGKLDGELKTWTSFPAKVEWAAVPADKKDLASRAAKITVDASVPVGLGGIVIANAAGNADPVFLLVDDLASVSDNGQNHSIAQAQAVTLPVAIDGASDGAIFDFYKFTGKKGQRVSAEVVASRIGAALDPVLRVLDATGRELMLVDDDSSVGADCRLSLTLPADGEYILELRDNQFRGGSRYRLRLGDFPLVSTPFPLGGRLGSTMRFRFGGPAAEGAAPVFLRLPDEGTVAADRGIQAIAAKLPNGQSSAMAAIATSRLPDILEIEPNQDWKVATMASLPCAVNGTFQEPRDRDVYQFAATKGQAIQFRAVTRSLGAPTYPVLRILNGDGNQVAESPVNDADEATLTYTFPADGMYGLAVEDLLGRGGPDFSYRVEMEPNLGFSLTLKQDKDTKTKFVPPAKSGAFTFTVTAARRGYDGPIQLAIESPLSGMSLVNAVIPEKVNEQKVIVQVPADAPAGALGVFRVTGSAVIQGRTYQTVMSTAPALKARWPQVLFAPAWADGILSASIGSESAPFYQVTSSATPVKFARAQGTVQFNVTLERKNGEFKDAITLLVQGLPSGFSSAVKADKDTYQVTITGPKDAAHGKHEMRLVAYGEFKGTGQLQAVTVPWEIAD